MHSVQSALGKFLLASFGLGLVFLGAITAFVAEYHGDPERLLGAVAFSFVYAASSALFIGLAGREGFRAMSLADEIAKWKALDGEGAAALGRLPPGDPGGVVARSLDPKLLPADARGLRHLLQDIQARTHAGSIPTPSEAAETLRTWTEAQSSHLEKYAESAVLWGFLGSLTGILLQATLTQVGALDGAVLAGTLLAVTKTAMGVVTALYVRTLIRDTSRTQLDQEILRVVGRVVLVQLRAEELTAVEAIHRGADRIGESLSGMAEKLRDMYRETTALAVADLRSALRDELRQEMRSSLTTVAEEVRELSKVARQQTSLVAGMEARLASALGDVLRGLDGSIQARQREVQQELRRALDTGDARLEELSGLVERQSQLVLTLESGLTKALADSVKQLDHTLTMRLQLLSPQIDRLASVGERHESSMIGIQERFAKMMDEAFDSGSERLREDLAEALTRAIDRDLVKPVVSGITSLNTAIAATGQSTLAAMSETQRAVTSLAEASQRLEHTQRGLRAMLEDVLAATANATAMRAELVRAALAVGQASAAMSSSAAEVRSAASLLTEGASKLPRAPRGEAESVGAMLGELRELVAALNRHAAQRDQQLSTLLSQVGAFVDGPAPTSASREARPGAR